MTLVSFCRLYAVALVTFFVVDLVWLGVVARGFYQTHMGHLMRANVNWPAAIVFYLIFVSGIVIFVVGPAIERLFGGSGDQMSGTSVLVLGFLIAVVLKIAQGSSTVAMIIGSSMVAAIVAGKPLDFNLVYVATAIGGGSLVGSWMNDSGFWIFAKMGGLTEAEALKSWTVLLSILGIVSFGFSLLLANVLPLVAG